jgi:hypothetical protein
VKLVGLWVGLAVAVAFVLGMILFARRVQRQYGRRQSREPRQWPALKTIAIWAPILGTLSGFAETSVLVGLTSAAWWATLGLLLRWGSAPSPPPPLPHTVAVLAWAAASFVGLRLTSLLGNKASLGNAAFTVGVWTLFLVTQRRLWPRLRELAHRPNPETP